MYWGDSTRRCRMRESTLTVSRWTPTRKTAVILERLRGGDAVGVSPETWTQPSSTVCLAGSVPASRHIDRESTP